MQIQMMMMKMDGWLDDRQILYPLNKYFQFVFLERYSLFTLSQKLMGTFRSAHHHSQRHLIEKQADSHWHIRTSSSILCTIFLLSTLLSLPVIQFSHPSPFILSREKRSYKIKHTKIELLLYFKENGLESPDLTCRKQSNTISENVGLDRKYIWNKRFKISQVTPQRRPIAFREKWNHSYYEGQAAIWGAFLLQMVYIHIFIQWLMAVLKV